LKFYIEIMSIARNSVFIFLILVVLACVAGCLTYSFGDVAYDDDLLRVQVTNEGDARQVVLQVTIFETKDFNQTELYRKAEFYDLKKGENEYRVPIHLEPGSYKLYLYVTIDGTPVVREIRNIEVS
jgi:hypothetical protein